MVDEDPDRARDTARGYAKSYLSLANYRSNLQRLGFADDELVNGGSDRLLNTVVPQGSPDDIARVVRQHLDAGAHHVCLRAIGVFGVPEAEWTALARTLIQRSAQPGSAVRRGWCCCERLNRCIAAASTRPTVGSGSGCCCAGSAQDQQTHGASRTHSCPETLMTRSDENPNTAPSFRSSSESSVCSPASGAGMAALCSSEQRCSRSSAGTAHRSIVTRGPYTRQKDGCPSDSARPAAGVSRR